MGSLVLTCLAVWLFRRSYARDPRQLRNGFYLACAAWFAVSILVEFTAYALPGVAIVWFALLALLPLCVLALAGFLVANGVTMVRKEGRSLGNLLSLVAGLALLGVPVLAAALVLTLHPVALGVAGLIFVAAGYLGVFFVVFLGYSLFYLRNTRVTSPAAIVVLGSGLIDGKVPPLLRGRIDRAVELWRTHPGAVLIPSGGQGEDEPRPEAEAMAEYMIDSGVPAGAILPEDRSRTTRENLLNAQAVLRQRRPSPESAEVVAVTSNYHALRAALTARDVGSSAQVIGAPTAWYFLPSAFLREYVAVLARHRGMHVVLLTPFVVLAAACVALLIFVT